MELERTDIDNFAKNSNKGLNKIIDRITMFSRTYKVLLDAERYAEKNGWQKTANYLLQRFDVSCEIKGTENIPSEGPAIYVSNHPWGIIDGLYLIGPLGEEISKKGRKLKVIGTHQIKAIKGIEEAVIFVDRIEEYRAIGTKRNLSSIRKVLEHLSEGNDIAFFPASSPSYRINGEVKDPEWGNFLGKLSSHGKIVPMKFSGPKNGVLYNLAATIRPNWRYALFFREAWNKKGEKINLTIGKKIYSEQLTGLSYKGKTRYIRKKSEDIT